MKNEEIIFLGDDKLKTHILSIPVKDGGMIKIEFYSELPEKIRNSMLDIMELRLESFDDVTKLKEGYRFICSLIKDWNIGDRETGQKMEIIPEKIQSLPFSIQAKIVQEYLRITKETIDLVKQQKEVGII